MLVLRQLLDDMEPLDLIIEGSASRDRSEIVDVLQQLEQADMVEAFYWDGSPSGFRPPTPEERKSVLAANARLGARPEIGIWFRITPAGREFLETYGQPSTSPWRVVDHPAEGRLEVFAATRADAARGLEVWRKRRPEVGLKDPPVR